MKRTDTPELLDSDSCPPEEALTSLRDLARINRWFGGISTSLKLLERAANVSGRRQFSLLEVGAGLGEVPRIVAQRLATRGISVETTLLDLQASHLPPRCRGVAADALGLPFADNAFDAVSCNLFAHHLGPKSLGEFFIEALRVSRVGVLINDLVRHPLHLALVYAGFPLMRSHVSRHDGVASVRRAYTLGEIQEIASNAFPAAKPEIEISCHYLFRMGIILWKQENLSGQPALL